MIDVGGGFRAIYGAGVMDRMLEDGISVDHCYGVSAGNRGKKDTPERRAQVEQDLNRALEAGYALLEQGAPAEDAVCAAIRVMEDAPEFNAGRGAALTSEGIVSMDS